MVAAAGAAGIRTAAMAISGKALPWNCEEQNVKSRAKAVYLSARLVQCDNAYVPEEATGLIGQFTSSFTVSRGRWIAGIGATAS